MTSSLIIESDILELLRESSGRLFHREGQELEFKEQFNLAALAEYFRDFAAFANNRGGFMIFGVKDAPRIRIGMSKKSIDQFERVDPERITHHLLETFSAEIEWSQAIVEIDRKQFGVFRISSAKMKPVIAKTDEGKGSIIKNGEIYYRYGGRTQKIQSAELENIINHRVEHLNRQWIDLVTKIGKAGPQNAAIVDTERALIEKGDSRVLVLDEDLAEKLRFIKEGEFVERKGAAALRLIGDIVPVDHVEVVKKVKENLTRAYPLSARELAEEVQRRLPKTRKRDIWTCIRENGIKDNRDYSAYNFRSKKHEDHHHETGVVPNGTPSIYNEAAVEFIVKVLRDGDSNVRT